MEEINERQHGDENDVPKVVI